MIDRDNLVYLIYINDYEWTCSHSKSCMNKECKDCASELLAEYESKIYNKALDDFIRTAKENKHQVEGVDITPAFIKTIEYLVEEVKVEDHE